MRPFLLSAAVAAVLAAGARADEPPTSKVFNVAELVIPVPDFAPAEMAPALPGKPRAPTPAERFRGPTADERADKLIRQVMTVVRPGTWAPNGAGTIEYFQLGHTLLVKNSPDVVAAVGDYLAALTRFQDVCVSTEVRLLSMPAGFAAGAGLNAGAVLSEADIKKVMDAAQGDAQCQVMQAPKVTTADGQVATIWVGEHKLFVTGVEAVPTKTQAVCVPQNKAAGLGDAVTLCGRVTADGTAVSLRVHAARTRLLDEKVELVPVTTMITPVFEGGSQGKPVPFTQFVQAPRLKTDSCEAACKVPDGATLVVGGWTEAGGRVEAGVPVMSRIPYVNRLFKTVGIGPDREVIVLATPRVLNAAPPAAEVAPMPREVVADEVEVKVLMADVSEGFARAAGLDPAADTWFAPAGAEAVNLALRADPVRALYARPVLRVVAGQTGTAEGGAEGAAPRLTARVSPAVSADRRSVRLRVGTEVAVGGRTQATETTVVVPAGGTAIVRGGGRETPAGPVETLFFLTPKPAAK